MKSENIISLEKLCFGYDDRGDVLKNISLDIPKSTITAILGPNGAGKTTLLHTILGLLTVQSGTVKLKGELFSNYSRRELSQMIGLVAQNEYIPYNFTVMEYVLLGRTPYMGLLEMPRENDYEIATNALDTLGLMSLSQRTIMDLSGGEKQMVLLARALAQQPEILLLDEPTSHLDLSNKGRLLEVLNGLVKKGVTVAFTTHDPDSAGSIADFIILMREGRILNAGSLQDVLTTEELSETYGVPVQVLSVNGRLIALLKNPKDG